MSLGAVDAQAFLEQRLREVEKHLMQVRWECQALIRKKKKGGLEDP